MAKARPLLYDRTMAELARTLTDPLYEEDFAAWADAQARVLRDRTVHALDWNNLAEEVESLGRRERNEARTRLTLLIAHLLKWQFQPERRGHSWQSTIGEQRVHLTALLEDSPSLKSFPAEILAACYRAARRIASTETARPIGTFPPEAPYSIEQILSYDFMPGNPWSPEDLS